MNEEIKYMADIYETYEVDWMGEVFKSLSELTRHHIVKREKGGIDDISNYALLTFTSHILLHFLELNYPADYIELNRLFKELNGSKKPPSAEYYKKVKSIIKKAKKAIKNKNRKRPKGRIR